MPHFHDNQPFVSRMPHSYTPLVVDHCNRLPISENMNPSPISRLSPELLSYIIYLSSAQNEISSPKKILDTTARCTSQVNRQWRSISLKYGLIWLGVLNWYSSAKWVEEVLRRSDPLPLDVVIPLDAAIRCPLVVSMALMHLSRIRRLELTLEASAWWFIVQSKQLKTRAPLLEEFSLKIKAGIVGHRHMCIPESLNTFGSHAPRLEEFRIQNCSVDLTQSVFASLRVLVIDEIQHISLPDFLDILRPMKYLETLRMVRPPDNTMCNVYATQALISDVHMLSLSELVISAPLPTCAGILRFLVLPESCSIIIDAFFQPGDDIRAVFPRFEDILRNWTCEPLTGRQCLTFGMTEAGFSIEGPAKSALSLRKHPSLSLSLWWCNTTQAQTLFVMLPLLTSLFGRCAQPPYTLSVMASRDVDPHQYPHIRNLLLPCLEGLTYIQAIEFHGQESFSIMERLFRYPRLRLDALLPDLGDVTFVEVDFTTQRRRCWRRLLKVLKFRASREVDAPILQLDFVRCRGDFRRENLSRRFGTVVKIDGIECSDNEDDDEGSDYTVQELSD